MALRVQADPADPLGPRWVEQMARDITALGSPTVLTLLIVATCALLLLGRRVHDALMVLGATASGGIATRLLKLSFDRPRPEFMPHDLYIASASFPSGHAMGSAVVYLTLAAMLARVIPGRRFKLFVLFAAATLAVLVGISRVYLGVHWPSDVVAGWAAGAFWAIAWWVAAWGVDRWRARTVRTG
jgi:undecaprenyl-diphosphatase